MDNFTLQRMSMPVVTGTPQVQPQRPDNGLHPEQQGPSFKDILSEKLAGSAEVTFSKHAANRVVQRGIDLSDQSIKRLNEGIKLAQGKGLGDTLILVDRTAFIVNAQNKTVITTVDSGNLTGNVFTNIEGTVVI